jgi:hypothetical protein
LARRVDPALTRRARAALDRAAAKAKASEEGLSDWEAEFLASVKERLETYGSAFADPDKGQLSAPLSLRQGLKVRQIARKGEPKTAEPASKDRPAKPRKPLTRKPLTRKPLARKTPLKPSRPKPS